MERPEMPENLPDNQTGKLAMRLNAFVDEREAKIEDLKELLLENFRDKTTCMHPLGTHCSKCSGCDVIDDQIKAIEEKYECS